MKQRLTLLLLLIASVAHAQYDYYYDGPMFGVGAGYNFASVVGDDVRPFEISLRYRINNDNLLQLFVPFLWQNDAYKSQNHPEMELIDISLDTKKRLYGIGVDYDYALQRYSSLDFVIGLRAEYQRYEYLSNLANNHRLGDTQLDDGLYPVDLRYRNKKTNNYIISPNIGMRFNLYRFSVDAKFLLSMLSMRGDVDHRIEAREPSVSSKVSITEEWTDEISNKFKLKPGIMVSMSYFF